MKQNIKQSVVTKRTDIIVVGSGIAGLYFALQAADYAKVTIVTKKELMESNSNYAQGGIAAVLDPLDNFSEHIQDTLVAGAHLNNPAAVELLVKEAPKHIHRLIELGVGFNRTKGKLDLTREGGHSKRRIVHVHDATGKEVERALIFGVRNHPNISIYESHIALELLSNRSQSAVGGVLTLNRFTKQLEKYIAKYVVIATGGVGQIYSRTTNPRIATGDGIAMSKRIGAKLQDMEFVQFHPTTLQAAGKPHFLLSEALRGEGAVLRNSSGVRFMNKYDKRKELAPRDIVSRAVYDQLQQGNVFLDITHKSSAYIKRRFPYIYEELWWFGLKLDQDRVPISPAAHYLCGGIATDLYGKTSIHNLYAIGEAAYTGVHGANRLASNSILECLVFAARANYYIKHHIKKYQRVVLAKSTLPKIVATPKAVYQLRSQIQNIMWNQVGIIREYTALQRANKRLYLIHQQIHQLQRKGTSAYTQETLNICELASAVTTAALQRSKSIGCHYIREAATLGTSP